MPSREDLGRIAEALAAARDLVAALPHAARSARAKQGGDPVTELDTQMDARLRALLPRAGEGWLSEETADDGARLTARRVWVVDPLDGTKEFVAGIPEWAISIGLVEEGEAVAGGVCNPAAGVTVVGAVGLGIEVTGAMPRSTGARALRDAEVLASRSEVKRGEWARFASHPFLVVPLGSVAWKLARVAAGLADATWTLSPKHEWDVAGGAALVRAAGGAVLGLDGKSPHFNRSQPWLPGLVACAPGLEAEVRALLGLP